MRLFLTAAMMFAATAVSAAEISVGIWNVSQGTIESVARRGVQLASLGAELKRVSGELPPVMILEEITSFAAATAVAKSLGYASGTVAVSDAGADNQIWPFALEVAIITTLPVTSVTSYQSKPNPKFTPFIVDLGSGNITNGNIIKLVVPVVAGIDAEANVPRAVLRVELEGGTVIYGVHFNSSGLGFCRLDDQTKQSENLAKTAEALGLTTEATAIRDAVARVEDGIAEAKNPGVAATAAEAFQRASTREAAAAAIAQLAEVDVASGKTVFVGGDFNTPLNEPCKTGTDLAEDFQPLLGCNTGITPATCDQVDGFDDTIAVLTQGLAGGATFRVLTEGIGRTFASPNFVDSPIDNVLIAGSSAEFEAHKLIDPAGSKPFGSDHHPVVVNPQ
jgi:hypothetical protein